MIFENILHFFSCYLQRFGDLGPRGLPVRLTVHHRPSVVPEPATGHKGVPGLHQRATIASISAVPVSDYNN
jgi:hypothetical protein